MINFRNKKLGVVLYLLIFILFYYVLKPVTLTFGDDFVNRDVLLNRTFLTWVSELYYLWSGRIVLTSLLVFVLNLPLFIWRLANAFFFVLLVYSIVKLSRLKDNYVMLVVFGILTLPLGILSSSTFWITGSVVYLWSVSSMFYLFYILKLGFENEVISIKQVVFSSFCALLASNNEQTAIVLLVFYLLIMIYQKLVKSRIDYKIYIIFIILLIGFIVLMIAPGNFNRLDVEVAGIKPAFHMLDTYDKLLTGLTYTLRVLFNELKWMMLTLSSLLFIKTLKIRKHFFISFFTLALITFKLLFDYYIFRNPFCTICNDVYFILFNYRYFEVYYFTEWIHLVPIFIGLVYLSLTAFTVIKSNADLHEGIFPFLIFTSGISSAIIMGFSPTIEASGMRIFFLMSINLISLLVYYMNNLLKQNRLRKLEFVLMIVGLYFVFRYAIDLASVTEFIVNY